MKFNLMRDKLPDFLGKVCCCLLVVLLSWTAVNAKDLPSNQVTDMQSCLNQMQPYQNQKWCSSPERKECLLAHGDFCDDQEEANVKHADIDKHLNATYRATLRSFTEDPEITGQLRSLGLAVVKSQKAWLTFIKADCEATLEAIHGGDAAMRASNYMACLDSYMTERIDRLDTSFCQSPKGCKR